MNAKSRMHAVLQAAKDVGRDLEEIQKLEAPWNVPYSWITQDADSIPAHVLKMATQFAMHDAALKLVIIHVLFIILF